MKHVLIAVMLLSSLAVAQGDSALWQTPTLSVYQASGSVMCSISSEGKLTLAPGVTQEQCLLRILKATNEASARQHQLCELEKQYIFNEWKRSLDRPAKPTSEQIQACTPERARASMEAAQKQWRQGDHLQLDAVECKWKVVKTSR